MTEFNKLPPIEDPTEIAIDHPYYALTPDHVLDAVEKIGLLPNGRFLALNSYENRVYQVGIEEQKPVVAKFYRPGRWSDEMIQEEHAFTIALAAQEIPVVAPMVDTHGTSLHVFDGYRFAVYPSHGGRAPEFDDPEHLEWIGRFIGRIQQDEKFQYRHDLNIDRFAIEPIQVILQKSKLPDYLRASYQTITDELVAGIRHAYARAGTIRNVRVHGDCHPGNVLWTNSGPHFVDFDDTMMAPAIQDLWMMVSGDRQERALQLSILLEGYETFRDFNRNELHILEALRAMRMIHYAAWLTLRWKDPAFPLNFPWFNTPAYWEQHILSLREQVEIIAEPPLSI